MTNKNNNADNLVEHLKAEISWVDQLNTLLSEEKEMLTTRQFERLEDIAVKKQELSNQLETSAAQRIALLNTSSAKSEPNIWLKEFLKNCTTTETVQINNLNLKLIEKLATCRDLNSVNGQVIANNLYTRQEIVNALSGNTSESVSVYNANGGMQSSANKGYNQKA